MMNVPENELFSAYLDGELTAAEQAEMERLLATSPAARQLLEELRALSATLQSLPVHKLNEDLSQHVLRMAERRMLSGQTEPDPFSPRPVPSTGRWRALAGRLSRPRIWIWPAAAACVAILLAVLFPDRGARVAHLPTERPESYVVVAPAPRAPSGEPSIGPVTGATKEVALERRSADEVADAAREHFARSKEPAAKLSRLATVKKDEAIGDSLRVAATPAAPMAAPASSAPTAPPSPASAAGPAAKMGLAAAAAEAAKPAESKPAEVPARPMKGAGAGPADGLPLAKERSAEEARKSDEQEVLFVRLDVTAESWATGAFKQVLARRQIRWKEPSAEDAVALNFAAGRLLGVVEEKKAKVADRDSSLAEPADKRAEPAGKVVCLEAEATPAQLTTLLVDLRSQPAMVVSRPNVVAVTGPAAYGAMAQPFSFKAGAAKQPADAFQMYQTEGQPQQLHTNVYPQPGMKTAAGKSPMSDETQNVQNMQNQRNQPSLAESAGGMAAGNQMQNVQSRTGAANAIGGGVMGNQAQVSQSRSSFGMRQQRFADAETHRRTDAEMEKGGEGERGRRGDTETRRHGDTAGKDAGPMADQPGRSAGTGMAGLGGRAADRQEAQAGQKVEEAPSPAPAMPGMPAVQQAAPAQTFGGMPGGQTAPSRALKAKSEVGAYAKQEAGQGEGRRRVVFVLRVVDTGQIAAEKSGKAGTGEAKAALMDAARAAPAAARIAEPAKPAATPPPAAAAKK